MSKPTPTFHVWYHKNCFDGTMSAAILLKYGEHNERWANGINTIVPCSYQDDIGDLSQYAGKDLWLLDMTFDVERLEALAAVAANVLVIDHHPKARNQAEAYFRAQSRPVPDNLQFITDTEENPQSGAQLVWNYLYGTQPQPDCVRWIGKGDRWIFDEPEIRSFRLVAGTFGFNPNRWKTLLLDDPTATRRYLADEPVVRRVIDSQLDYLEENATSWMIIAGHRVITVDAPKFLASEIAQRLYEKYSLEESPFVAVHYEENGMLTYSLRQNAAYKPTIHLGELAAKFGGNGHANAAGFEVRITKAPLDPPTRKVEEKPAIFISRFFDPMFRGVWPFRRD